MNNVMVHIQRTASGNCNFEYLTGLYSYWPDRLELALFSAFCNTIVDQWSFGKSLPAPSRMVYQNPTSAMMLFAQDSDSDIETRGYGPKFQQILEENGLGKVWRSWPAPNPRHNNRPGVLFVWLIDREALNLWWHTQRDKMIKAGTCSIWE
jgi:hypothetical protein